MRKALPACIGILLVTAIGRNTAADEKPVGPLEGVPLLDGYVHSGKMGIHGPVGLISKKDGLKIEYHYGKVRGADDPITSADYFSSAQSLAEADRRWYMEQTVGGKAVQLAHGKDDSLHVSFPAAGVNFKVTVKTSEEMAEALLIILPFRGGPKVK